MFWLLYVSLIASCIALCCVLYAHKRLRIANKEARESREHLRHTLEYLDDCLNYIHDAGHTPMFKTHMRFK